MTERPLDETCKDMELAILAPASIANVGPCYDLMGYALEHLGDVVLGRSTRAHTEVRLIACYGPHADNLRETPGYDATRNCAAVAARQLLHLSGRSHGLDLVLLKNMPISSGLGSSAASGVAGAVCAARIAGLAKQDPRVQEAALYAENLVAGAPHPDNVIPCLFGGAHLMRAGEPGTIRLTHPSSMVTAVVKPRNAFAPTKKMRTLIPGAIDIQTGLDLAWRTARMAVAFTQHDIATIQDLLGRNEWLEERRGDELPHFRELQQLWRDAGAGSATIAGSGPALFSVFPNEAAAAATITGLRQDTRRSCEIDWLVSRINSAGAQELTCSALLESLRESSSSHTFHHDYYSNL